MEYEEATWGEGVVEGIENMLEHALERVPTLQVLDPVPTLQCPDDVRYRSFTEADSTVDRVGSELDFVFQKRHPAPVSCGTHLPRLVKGADGVGAAQFKLFRAMASMGPGEIMPAFALSRRLGVIPSRACYHRAFGMLSAAGSIDRLLDVFDDMIADGVRVAQSTYKNLLEACISAGQTHVAVCIAHDAACTSGVQISPKMWKMLFQKLVPVGTLTEAEATVQVDDLAIVIHKLHFASTPESALCPLDYAKYCRQLVAAGRVGAAVDVFVQHVAPHVAEFHTSGNSPVAQQLANELIVAVTSDEFSNVELASKLCTDVSVFMQGAALENVPAAYLGLLSLADRTGDASGLKYFLQMRQRGIPPIPQAFVAACRLASASTQPDCTSHPILPCPASVFMWRCFAESYRALRSGTDGEQGLIWSGLLRCCSSCQDIVTAVHVLNMVFVLLDVRIDRRPLVREFVHCASSPGCAAMSIRLYEACRADQPSAQPQGMPFTAWADSSNYTTHVESALALARKLDVPVIKCLLKAGPSEGSQHAASLEADELFSKLWKRGLGTHLDALLSSEMKSDRSPITEWYVAVVDATALQCLTAGSDAAPAAMAAMMQQYTVRGGAAFLFGVDALAMLGKAASRPVAALLTKWLRQFPSWCSVIPLSAFVQIHLHDSTKAQLVSDVNWGCVWAMLLKQAAKRVILLTQDENFLRVATEEFRVRPTALLSQLLKKLSG